MSFFFAVPPDVRPQNYQRDTEGLSAAKQTTTHSSSKTEGTATPSEPISHSTTTDPSSGPPLPRKNIVFPDPVAFRYLEDDPCVTVIQQRAVLRGYEVYVVEQWACSRQSPTLVIVTYTGDEQHSVVVGVLSVPAEEALWSTRLRVYFKATRQFLARPKETDLGELMVTNLSSFPSSLTVIPVPDGDIRKHRQIFVVNEDLKRLGCSGRSGLTLTEPAEGTQAKFQSLYKVSDRVPFFAAVTELVKLCQVALYMFEKLEPEYIDGLLCDMTEKAIGNWWTEVGAEHYNFEPNDGILGPTTVAALLGMLMGARNRLYWWGAPVSKDVFDVESTKRGIAYFQKSFKLDKTRRLDRQTLLKLQIVTAKAAAGEGWGVQKAVKSRMKEIGGNRGEIVMGMVSGKDKGGLADVETLDLDRFLNFAYGERAKWLWFGKPRRTIEPPDKDQEPTNHGFGKEEKQLYRTQTLPTDDDSDRRPELQQVYSELPPGSAVSVADRRNVLKSVAGKVNDARSGFGRIKDVVGGNKRGHGVRASIGNREEMLSYQNGNLPFPVAHDQSAVAPTPAQARGRAFTWNRKPEEYLATMRRGDQTLSLPSESRDHSSSTDSKKISHIGAEVRQDVAPSRAESIEDRDLEGPLLGLERKDNAPLIGLSRRHSLEVAQLAVKHVFNEERWPRRMSFSDAAEAILTWEEVVDLGENAEELNEVEALAEFARHLNQSIDDIAYNVNPWVEEKLKTVALLDERFARDKEDLQALYHQLNEACQRVRYNSQELLSDERGGLTESVKDIEVLVARLEYEINSLASKVVDVEDGIQNFEHQVEDVEKRAADLKAQLETESWAHWFVRTLTGVGTGPNITRAIP